MISLQSKQLLSLYLFSTLMLFAAQGQDSNYLCQFERPQICTFIYQPVCAFYPIFCIRAPCPQYQEFSNACVACSDPATVSYRDGPCTPEELGGDSVLPPLSASEESLEGELLEVEVLAEEFFNEENLETEFFSELELSNSEDASTVILCDITRPEICPSIWDPVCVVDCVDGADCTRNAGNACEACSDVNVLSYQPGECPVEEPEKIYCPITEDISTEVFCPAIYDPVCAYPLECDQESCATTVGNSCEACGQYAASYYTQGECSGDNLVSPLA